MEKNTAAIRHGLTGLWPRALLCALGFAAFAALCLAYEPDGMRWGWIAASAGFSLACFVPHKKKMGRRLAALLAASAILAALTLIFLRLLSMPLAAFLAALSLFVACAWACREARRLYTPAALCLVPLLLWSGYMLFATYVLAMLAP